MFRRMVASGGKCSSLKQAVQARASVYGEMSEPSWFTKNYDVGGKAQTLKQRRIVRSQLASAPLLVAQTGLYGVQTALHSGDDSVLEQMRLGDHASVIHILKLLSRASPFSVLKLLNKVTARAVGTRISQVSTDLDFVQSVLDLVSQRDELNPSLNAVTAAFRRRHLGGSFTLGENTAMMDALLYANTKSTQDGDILVATSKSKKKKPTSRAKASRLACYAFQRGNCTWEACRFDHRCILCGSEKHGEADCPRHKSKRLRSSERSEDRKKTQANAAVPPNPRSRRDR